MMMPEPCQTCSDVGYTTELYSIFGWFLRYCSCPARRDVQSKAYADYAPVGDGRMRTARPEHKRREQRQTQAVRERDRVGGKLICLMERKTKRGWERCGRVLSAIQTIHIVRRNECGEFWDDPIVAIVGCFDCHKVYDHRFLGEAPFEVRVPYEPACMAWDFVFEKFEKREIKSRPAFRFNPYENPVYAELRGAA